MLSRALSLFLVCFWFRDCIVDLLTPEVTIFNICYSLPYRQAEKETGLSERLLVTQSFCFLPSFLPVAQAHQLFCSKQRDQYKSDCHLYYLTKQA